MRALLVFAAAQCSFALAGLAHAQATPAAPGIVFPNVAAALKDLQARDGNGTIVINADGWIIVNEPAAAAQWSFTPAGHAAHPAVVRRIIRRGADGNATVETAHLCEAPQAACEKLLADFASLNDRIMQTARARGRPLPAKPE